MKAVLAAVGLIAVTATSASAQFWGGPSYAPVPWSRGSHPYAERHHRTCQEKAWRLHGFERRAASDGVITPRERAIMRELRWDLDRTCGRFRWRG